MAAARSYIFRVVIVVVSAPDWAALDSLTMMRLSRKQWCGRRRRRRRRLRLWGQGCCKLLRILGALALHWSFACATLHLDEQLNLVNTTRVFTTAAITTATPGQSATASGTNYTAADAACADAVDAAGTATDAPGISAVTYGWATRFESGGITGGPCVDSGLLWLSVLVAVMPPASCMIQLLLLLVRAQRRSTVATLRMIASRWLRWKILLLLLLLLLRWWGRRWQHH